MRKALIAVIGVLSLASVSYAATITTGTFDISGTIYVTGTGVVVTPAGTCPSGTACIFWQDLAAGDNLVDVASTGLPNGDIPSAMAGAGAANALPFTSSTEPVGSGGFSPMAFMSFNTDGITTQLLLDLIPPGIDGSGGCSASPPAAGQVCTPVGSLFNLQNTTTTSSTVTWNLDGVVMNGVSVTGTWSGTFTSQFNTLPFQTVLANLAANGYVDDTFAAQITLVPNSVPEPGTLGFTVLGGAVIGLSTMVRRRLQR